MSRDVRNGELDAQILEAMYTGDARRIITLLGEKYGLRMSEDEIRAGIEHLLMIVNLPLRKRADEQNGDTP